MEKEGENLGEDEVKINEAENLNIEKEAAKSRSVFDPETKTIDMRKKEQQT